MSVSTNSNTDTSTDNAIWGTLVIVLILVTAAVFIGVALYNDHQKPAPAITVSAPASPAPTVVQGAPALAGPSTATMPSSGSPSGGQ